jgi:hypothetical protein
MRNSDAAGYNASSSVDILFGPSPRAGTKKQLAQATEAGPNIF